MKFRLFILAMSTFLFLLSCQNEATKPPSKALSQKPNKMKMVELTNSITQKEKDAGWQLLFDGRSLEHWKGYNLAGALPSNWEIRDGEIVGHGQDNLITKEQYENFDFQLEFNLSEAANSGIFYFAQEVKDKPIYQSAPEYQLIDNFTYIETQGADIMHQHLTGDVFNLYDGVINPGIKYGKWHTARIVVENNHVEHWLNGKLCIEYDWNSPEWNEKVANSNFSKTLFAAINKGHIGLQGWGNDIRFRNIKIRKL